MSFESFAGYDTDDLRRQAARENVNAQFKKPELSEAPKIKSSPKAKAEVRPVSELVPIFFKRLIKKYHPDLAAKDQFSQEHAHHVSQKLIELKDDHQKFINYALKLCEEDGIDLYELLSHDSPK